MIPGKMKLKILNRIRKKQQERLSGKLGIEEAEVGANIGLKLYVDGCEFRKENLLPNLGIWNKCYLLDSIYMEIMEK
jgi:hypothetical protein